MTAMPSRMERTLSLSAFWIGAAKVREAVHAETQSLDAIPGLYRCYAIEAGLNAGKPLGEIPAFAEWMRARAGR